MRQRKLNVGWAVTYNIAINACEKSSQWSRAVSLLREMALEGRLRCRGLQPDSESYGSAICAAADARQGAVAVSLLEEMPGQMLAADASAYSAALAATSAAQWWEESCQLLEGLRAQGLPRTLALVGGSVEGSRWRERGGSHMMRYATTVIAALSRRSFWREALVVFDEGVRQRRRADSAVGSSNARDLVKVYNSALGACQRGHRAAIALDVLREMRGLAMQGVGPDIISYNSAIGACSSPSTWRAAPALLKELRSVCLTPDAVTLGNAISACSRGHAWEQAVSVLELVAERGVRPDTATLNAAIAASDRGPGTHSTVALLRLMTKWRLERDAITYNTAIASFERAGRWSHALELFDSMRKDGYEMDSVSLLALLAACRRGRQWKTALALFVDSSSRLPPTVASCVAAISACEGGGSRVAVALLREMSLAGLRPRIEHFNAAFGALAVDPDPGAWATSLSLLSEAKSRWLVPDDVTYNLVIGACGAHGRWETAVALLAAAQIAAGGSAGLQVYNATATALERARQWEQAIQMLYAMRANFTEPDAITYQVVILAVVGIGDVAASTRARVLFDEACALGLLDGVRPSGELDLHGLPVEVARLAVRVVAERFDTAAGAESNDELRVITGRGLHSPSGSAAVRRAVLDDFACHARIRADMDAHNPGCIVLTRRR
eukprot:TRINITY_DN29029_c0_g1_i1.p1 TRINITY_DN29029_c0_g1~~TRINITY_DN29029_c0_g1_i1.p1  ORF type:complete len:774 (-),score=124.08 TRINITY_DN29029_c0_g1_i1:36-2048(-)